MYFSHNKEGLLPYTAISEYISKPRRSVFPSRHEADHINFFWGVTSLTWQDGYEFFQINPFYQYSDESVDEWNRLLLTTECHNKKDNLDFPFIFQIL